MTKKELIDLDIPTIKLTKQRSLDGVFDSQEMSECKCNLAEESFTCCYLLNLPNR